jgi:hypothetical protein
MMEKLLRLKGWRGKKMSMSYSDSCLSCLEKKAERFHNEILEINKHVVVGFYRLTTTICGWESTNHYKLKVKIRYYDDRSKQKHKENTHNQKIYI